MDTASGPICEITYVIDREIVDAFDVWLAQHIEETLQGSGAPGAEGQPATFRRQRSRSPQAGLAPPFAGRSNNVASRDMGWLETLIETGPARYSKTPAMAHSASSSSGIPNTSRST